MELTILGTSSMVPTKERNPLSVFLSYKGEGILFDCAEGTQRQMDIAGISRAKVKKILISHWHGDHIAGLIGLFQTIGNQAENPKIELYGPKGTKKFVNNLLNNQLLYGAIYFLLVFFFTYFYVSVTFDPNEISQNLHRSGGFVAGIRPGKPTADFIRSIVTKINFFGGFFLGIVAILPLLTQALTKTQVLTIGGTSILIAVAVALETAKQLDAEISVHEYERGVR